jgi:hypothetical protein
MVSKITLSDENNLNHSFKQIKNHDKINPTSHNLPITALDKKLLFLKRRRARRPAPSEKVFSGEGKAAQARAPILHKEGLFF